LSSNVKNVILIAISLIVIATILPLAIGLISNAGNTIITVANATGQNESARTLSDIADPSVITLLTILLPILAVIGITMYFLPKMRGKD